MPKVTAEYIEQKKKLIVESAAKVCDKKAVCSVTMQDVIDESGLSQGGIYRFYQNIDDILIEVLYWTSSFKIFALDEKIEVLKNNLEQERKNKLSENSKLNRKKIIKEFISQVCKELSTVLENNLHPFFCIHFGFSDMILNYPERAKYIFSKVSNPFLLEKEIASFEKELKKEINDGVLNIQTEIENVIEFLRTNFLGLIQTALIDERYAKDILGKEKYKNKITEQFVIIQKSVEYLLGL